MIHKTYIQDCLNSNYFLQALNGKYRAIIIPIFEGKHNSDFNNITNKNVYPKPINNILDKTLCIKVGKEFYLYNTENNTYKHLHYSIPFKVQKTFFTIKKRPINLLNYSKFEHKNISSNMKHIGQRLIFIIPLLISSIIMGIYYPNTFFRLIFIIPIFLSIILGIIFSTPKLWKENTLYFSYLHSIFHSHNIENKNKKFTIYFKHKNIFKPNRKINIYENEQILFTGKYAKEYLTIFCIQMKTLHGLNFDTQNSIIFFNHKNKTLFTATTTNSDNKTLNFHPTKIIQSKSPIKTMSRTWAKTLFKLGLTNTKQKHETKIFSKHIDITTKTITKNWENNTNTLIAPLGLHKNTIKTINLQQDGPHCLISGSTGSGKSETLITIILSLAIQYSPQNLRLILIDYKGGITFENIKSLPHIENIYTDLDQTITIHAIKSLKFEIQKREKYFLASKSKNIEEHNSKSKLKIPKIIVIIDEFLALSENNFEIINSLIDLTVRGRALGIHLILATQNTIGTIPTTIKTNISSQIYMDKNENTTNTNEENTTHKTPGKAWINKQEIQILWAGNPKNNCTHNVINNINKAKQTLSRNKNFTITTPIITPMLDQKIKITTENIIFDQNNTLPIKTLIPENSFSQTQNTQILFGIKNISDKQGIYKHFLETGTHNLQIPNYNFQEYLKTLIYQLHKNNLTLIISSEEKTYKHYFPPHISNLLFYTPNNSITISKIFNKYKNEKITINILIDNWEELKEHLFENKIDPQNYMEKLLTYTKLNNSYLIVFSQKPIKNFKHHYYSPNNQENILWKNPNSKNNPDKNIEGRFITYKDEKIFEIQLPKLFTDKKELKLKLQYTQQNKTKYVLPIPKSFLYSYENTNIQTRKQNSNSKSYIIGIEELTHKHIEIKYAENNIVLLGNDYEKQMFIKTFLKIPHNNTIYESTHNNHIQINSPLTETINKNTNIFTIPMFVLKIRKQQIQVINLDYTLGQEEIILEHINSTLPVIIFMNSNNYLLNQNIIYKTFNQYCNKIIFSAHKKIVELFEIHSEEKIFFTSSNSTQILFIKNNKHTFLQLAQIT